MAESIKLVKEVYFEGQCSGGESYDNMGKPIPCPKKSYSLPADHPTISNQANWKNPVIRCTRCGTEIELTQVVKTANKIQCTDTLPS